MEDTMGSHSSDVHNDESDSGQWQDAIHLLQLMQDDFQGARQQLERVSRTLAQKESLINQRLSMPLCHLEAIELSAWFPLPLDISAPT